MTSGTPSPVNFRMLLLPLTAASSSIALLLFHSTIWIFNPAPMTPVRFLLRRRHLRHDPHFLVNGADVPADLGQTPVEQDRPDDATGPCDHERARCTDHRSQRACKEAPEG